ncbi:hypothetical protein WJX73_006230 [Symbiochloris irregularis]|uniref:SAP domain-containing protein n=1 Tax=Symbiochloris irregularis TaxID=706552 RepID=A0AAW1PDR4_9CHLO
MEFDGDEGEGLEERQDEYSAQGWLPPLKECIVFLVDAQPYMLEASGVSDLAGFSPSDSWLEIALKVIRGLYKQHIISSPADSLAVVFYGTKEVKNDSGLDNVYIYQELQPPTAQDVRDIDELFGSGFKDKIGSNKDADSGGESVLNALWVAHTLLSKAPRAVKRVTIFTQSTDPTRDNATKRQQVQMRVEQMRSLQAELELYPMQLDEDFDYEPFWGKLLATTAEEAEEASLAELPNRLQALDVTVRQRAYRRRVLCHSSLRFSDSFALEVSIYALLQPAVKSSHQWVTKKDLAPLKTDTTLLCHDTGEMLTEVPKLSFPKVGEGKPHPRIPPLLIAKDDMDAVKRSGAPGLQVLGFAPRTALQDYHQIRNSSFLYPSERQQNGATTAFVALHQVLLDEDCIALASFIRNRSAEPQRVALVAQQELRDSYGNQIEPPGINLIYLPYSDDIRSPETDPSFVGSTAVHASQEQIQLAQDMMSSLQLPDFNCYDIPNPVLQRHFEALEALALEEPVPNEIPDDVKPDVEGMRSASEAVLAFRDAVLGPGNDGAGPTKKSAGAGAKRKPDAAAEAAAADINYKELAQTGELGTLTVPDLKLYCAANGLVKTGKKADIITRIEEHLQKSN